MIVPRSSDLAGAPPRHAWRRSTWFADRIALGAVLAPMAGFTDAPFRRLARHFGAAWAVSEMVSAHAMALSLQDARGLQISAPYDGEPFVVIQVFAADADLAARAVARLERTYRPDAFDLNLGCPVKKVVNRGCGSELLRDPAHAAAVLGAMVRAASVPVSAKMRLGIDADVSLEVAYALEEAGAAAIAVHGRTALQRYQGSADWASIARVAAAVRVPVIGSGDVRDVGGYRRARRANVGVMIARAAVGRPWVFDEVLGGERPTSDEIAAVVWRHARDQAAWYGGERPLRSMRAHLAAYAAELAAAGGRPAWSDALRAALVRVDTLADVREAFASIAGIDVATVHRSLGDRWVALAEAPETGPVGALG